MTPPAELTICILTDIWASLTSTEEYTETLATRSPVSKQWDATVIEDVNSMHSLIPFLYSGGLLHFNI